MATIKSFTSLEQSKKLAEILPLDSADMFYADLFVNNKHNYIVHPLETYGFETFKDTKQQESKHLSFLPCWSLTALLSVLPRETRLLKSATDDIFYHTDCPKGNVDEWFDNPVDACYELILKLHELKM